MPLTAEDVKNKQFTPTRFKGGYDEKEVDDFLDEVEAELTRLYRENTDLRARLQVAEQAARQPGAAPVGRRLPPAPARAAPSAGPARELHDPARDARTASSTGGTPGAHAPARRFPNAAGTCGTRRQ